VTHRLVGILFCFTFAAEASACVVSSSFFHESGDDALIDCLQREQFLSGRDTTDLSTVLHLAIATNKSRLVLDAVRRAADEGWPELRDRVDRTGHTALHLAITTEEPADSVRWLLNWGSNPNAMYDVDRSWNPAAWDYGITPLHLAASRTEGADVISALLLSDAHPEVPRPPRSEGWTAALIASRHAEDLRVLTALAAGGADLDAVAEDNNNSLHIAAAWDRPGHVIHFLLESGVSPDKPNNEGQTPLHLAARFSSSSEVIELLIEATDDPCEPDSRDRTGRELLRTNPALSEESALDRQFHEICIEGN
jgi:ankyrin repeat protein